MTEKFDLAIAVFGAKAKAKLANPSVTGQPEDQLRAPFEQLLADLAELSNFSKDAVAAVGETAVSDLKTRPDYAVTVHKALVGFIELKAPGKGADPRRFKDPHDKEQWEKLHSLPNLIYSDGNAFSLWQDGLIVDSVVRLVGDIETSGSKLRAPVELLRLFERFLNWEPLAPRNAKELAQTSARLCRLLRDEVTEQLALNDDALTSLAEDWRLLLFPEANDKTFADGYAQAVTFGLLMARARDIQLATGFDRVATELAQTSSLIGAALRLLTDNAENRATLKTSLGTLTRVLDAVCWPKISKGDPETWLYFYEDFLEVYDNTLRKQTGSYYTPPEVVGAMVRLVDDVLRSPSFGQHAGIASPTVTLADPATGTGTFVLGLLRKIAETVKADEGEGAVQGAISTAIKRLIAFEIQLGPFAVAQLRVTAEIADLTGAVPTTPIRMFVTDTLGDPDDDAGQLTSLSMLKPIAQSRKDANKIKRDEPITVIIGNPPYKEKAKGRGSWVEQGNENLNEAGLLIDWMPPPNWKVGAHSKHLRNLYIYFWRWATWKIFDKGPGNRTGIVCYITVAGFLNGPGFQKMRDYLRRTCDDIWVIDCSPEGYQPDVSSRIFQGVQQPICIVLAARSTKSDANAPATVRFQQLPVGNRAEKFAALGSISLSRSAWVACPTEWRAPFLPASTGVWANYPALEDMFIYNGSGVQTKRTWVIAPDAASLIERWQKLIDAPVDQKEALFHPTLRDGKPADRHIRSVVREPLPGYPVKLTPLIDEKGPCVEPVQYGFRSFNRQYILPDSRVITQPNAELWRSRSDRQIYLTALAAHSPSGGPALTVTGLVPDLHHYKGSFGGRVYPLWRDAKATMPNVRPKLLAFLTQRYGVKVDAEDVVAYVAGVAAHPAFTARFQSDLLTPGLHIPLTADKEVFFEEVELGRSVIWLHTFGDRMADGKQGRLPRPPRLPEVRRPKLPKAGAIRGDQQSMPDTIDYDAGAERLRIGVGYVENVIAGVWNYEIAGKKVVSQWFSYRKANRERPIMGDRRKPSPLCEIQPDAWLPEYTTELINVLNVIGLLLDLEPLQAAMLEKICDGPLIAVQDLRAAQVFEEATKTSRGQQDSSTMSMFDD